MAAIKHSRTAALQATSPRIVAVPLPTNVSVDFGNNVTGSLKPANNATVNRITTAATAPASPVDGDIWIDTSTTPVTVRTRIAGAWYASATYTTNTNQISDGAGLGLTALWANITGTGKPASNADVTATILAASGTSVVMTAAQLFKSGSGTAGVFIGAGGLFGKNSGGATTFSIDGATGAATFAGALSAASGTFAGTMSAAGITSGTMAADRISGGQLSITGTGGAKLMVSSSLGYTNIGNVVGSGYFEHTAGNNSKPGLYVSQSHNKAAILGFINGTPGSDAHAVYGENDNGAQGILGASTGVPYDVYAAGTAANYGPFTGSHDALVELGEQFELGDIMFDVGVAVRKNLSNTLCVVRCARTPNKKGVVGVASHLGVVLPDGSGAPAAMREIIRTRPPGGEVLRTALMAREFETLRHSHRWISINSLGEGQMNVCGEGGDLEPGDLIVSSSTPGKGMKQVDDIVRGHTVAKCREAVTFTHPGQIKTVACIYLCG